MGSHLPVYEACDLNPNRRRSLFSIILLPRDPWGFLYPRTEPDFGVIEKYFGPRYLLAIFKLLDIETFGIQLSSAH